MRLSKQHSRILFISCVDFESYPIGGHLTQSRQFIACFGNALALVGFTTDSNTKIGKWTELHTSDVSIPFLPVAYIANSAERPLIPLRIRLYLGLKRHKGAVLRFAHSPLVADCPEALLAVHDWNWPSILFVAHGVNNPLAISRYPLARTCASTFEKRLFKTLTGVDLVLANADAESIGEFLKRGDGQLRKEKVVHFRTYCDTTIFRPAAQSESRRRLGIPEDVPVFISCGRLNSVKGWDLLLEAFSRTLESIPGAQLYFVGDGEDRAKLLCNIAKLGLSGLVHLTGLQPPEMIARYLNASDVVVLGSHREGWPTAIVEAISCGKTVVTTNVSGAREMVKDGDNGFVVPSRDPQVFGDAMVNALGINGTACSLRIAQSFGLTQFKADVMAAWPPFALQESSESCVPSSSTTVTS